MLKLRDEMDCVTGRRVTQSGKSSCRKRRIFVMCTTVIFNVIHKRISPSFHLIAPGIKRTSGSRELNCASCRRISSSMSRVRCAIGKKEKKKENQECLIDLRLPGIISSDLSQTSSSLLRCNCDWRI